VARILKSENAPPIKGTAAVLSKRGGRALTVDERVPLSLTADRGRLGLDLTAPIEVGPLTVESLVLVFGNLRFPVDLSGGVPAFRHRRGELERVTISADLEQLKRWLMPKFRSVLGQLERATDIWLTDDGIGFGWTHASCAITGDLYWAPFGDNARFVLANVRGLNPNEPVLAEALRLIDVVLADQFERRGRVWVSHRVGSRIARLVLPAAGARAPSATGVTFGALLNDVDRVRTHLDVQLGELSLSPVAVRALELAELALPADEALIRGNVQLARQEYLRALESAPRHRDLILSVAELDLLTGGLEYTALGLLNDAVPAVAAGPVGAELLRITGDPGAAVQAIDAAVRIELYAPLRALLLVRKAKLEGDTASRDIALDAAVAAAPTLSSVRWARLEARAAKGDAIGALEDAALLESAALGMDGKFQTCIRCGSALQHSGLARQASKCFERALRYCPEDAAAAVGLAKAFIELRQPMRAVSLLERAIRKGDETAGTSTSEALVILARVLAKEVNDIPEAIARVRQVPAGTTIATEARLLEARWRFVLGDVVGASMAWARMRESIEMGSVSEAAPKWLREAAQFERDIRRDFGCAEQHLAVALRLSPRDVSLNALYREVAAALAAERTSPSKRVE